METETYTVEYRDFVTGERVQLDTDDWKAAYRVVGNTNDFPSEFELIRFTLNRV